MLVADPLAPRDDFVTEHGDVRGGSAERHRAQPQEQQGHFAHGAFGVWVRFGGLG